MRLIAENTDLSNIQICLNCDIVRTDGSHHLERPAQNMVATRILINGLHIFTAQRRNLLNDLLRLNRCLIDLIRIAETLRLLRQIHHQKICISHNRGQQVVELMRNSSGHRSHDLKTLLVSDSFLALMHFFENSIEFRQIGDPLRILLALHEHPSDHNSHHNQDSKENDENRDQAHNSDCNRDVDLIVVHNCTQHEKIFPDIHR